MDQVIASSVDSPIETLKNMINLADTVESKLRPEIRGLMFQIKRELLTVLNKEKPKD